MTSCESVRNRRRSIGKGQLYLSERRDKLERRRKETRGTEGEDKDLHLLLEKEK